MAINPIPLVGLQRETPDFVGQFLRGREFKANQDRQNQILGMQQQQFAAQQEAAEVARQERMRVAQNKFFGRFGDILAQAPPEQRQAIWSHGRTIGAGMGIPDIQEEMPEQYDPRFVTFMQRHARLSGDYAPEGEEFDKYYQTEDGGLVGVRGSETVPIDLNGQRLRDSGRTEVNINQSAQAGMTEEQKALAKSRVERYNKIRDTALAAEEQNVALDQLANIDVSTGFGEGAKSQVSRIINALGGNGEAITGVDPANVQAMNAVTGKMVLDVMASQKGPQTDKDQARIAKTLPSIANEQLANEFNMNALKGLNLRRIEMAQFYQRYLEEKETLKGADTAWSKFKRETPMLSDNVTNPATGLPMFYHQFRDQLLQHNPGANEQQAIKAWRKLTNSQD